MDAPTYTIRRATAADVPALARLNRQLIEDERSRNRMSLSQLETRMRAWVEGDWTVLLIEGEDGAPLGYFIGQARPDEYEPDRSEVYVRQYFIARGARGRGLGRHAFDEIARDWLPAGAMLVLESLQTNPRGRAFWESIGFAPYCVTYKRVSV